jgi:hypothetical protein
MCRQIGRVPLASSHDFDPRGNYHRPPPEAVWPLLSDAVVVAPCISSAVLTKSDEKGG